MNIFWPEGLSVSDVQSPYEVLETAREEWETASNGVLTLVLQRSKSEDGKTMIITVHAKHIPSNRTAALFSVIHRLNESYPITIRPREEGQLPNILRKSYYQPGMNDYNERISGESVGGTVTNKWVSDTPSEFREKLTEAFNLSEVKAAVLNLTSSKDTSMNDENAAQE
ncbi:MAG: hypothetical protein D3914_16745 [Candidatus Electrothrix sp. LOE2]|nr:hypothetical protein [Candidatus Electrothrix sp. LOE2]